MIFGVPVGPSDSSSSSIIIGWDEVSIVLSHALQNSVAGCSNRPAGKPPACRGSLPHPLTTLVAPHAFSPPLSLNLPAPRVVAGALSMHACSSSLGRSSSATPGRIWTILPAEDIFFSSSRAPVD